MHSHRWLMRRLLQLLVLLLLQLRVVLLLLPLVVLRLLQLLVLLQPTRRPFHLNELAE